MPELSTSYGIVPATLQGLVSNLVASAPRVSVGERPLATSVPLGTEFIALDTIYTGVTAVHPKNPALRIWMTPSNFRTDALATASAAGTTTSRLGVYDPATRVFTQATISGQFCNARSGATVGGLAVVSVSIALGALFASIGASNIAIGDEVMTDNAGLWVPYVNNGVNVPLGICPGFAAAGGSQTMLQYDW